MRKLLAVLIAALFLSVICGGAVFAEDLGVPGHTPVEYEDAGHAVADHGDDAHHGEHKTEGLPQLDPTWYASQIFWLVITYAFLYVVFSRKVLPELSATIDKRRERIDEDIEKAEDLKKKTEDVQKAYEESLSEARDQAAVTINVSEEDIKKESASAQAGINAKISEKVEAMEKKTSKAKAKAMKEIDDVAVTIAGEVVAKIIGTKIDAKQTQSIINKINKEAA